jgi:cell division protein FtsL
VLLAGIVFFNVDLLELNRDIAATAQRSSVVARENSRLRLQLARLDSSERIQRSAAEHGLLLPAPGDVRYLRANPLVDGLRAARLVEAPEVAAMAPEPVPQAATPLPQAATPLPQAAQPTAATPAPQPAAQPAPQPQQQPSSGTATTAAPTG